MTWGDLRYGGDSSQVVEQLAEVVEIQATRGAFPAIKENGTVVAWSDAGLGGDNSQAQEQLSVVTWGDPLYDGDSNRVQDQEHLTCVQQIQTTQKAFAEG